MDNLRWWLLLIAAVMFSMSGCASFRDRAISENHPTRFASSDHRSSSPEVATPRRPPSPQ